MSGEWGVGVNHRAATAKQKKKKKKKKKKAKIANTWRADYDVITAHFSADSSVN